MRKFFMALMAVAAIAIAGCEGRHVNEPEDSDAPENGRERADYSSDKWDSLGANQSSKAPIRMPLSTCE